MSQGTFMPWDQVATIVLLFSSSQFSVDPDQFNDTVNTAKFINYKMTVEKKVYLSLTAECRRPPLQDNSGLTALRSVRLQHVTQTLVCIGAAGTQIIHTRSIEHLGWHQLMTALKHGRLQDCTASVRSLTGRVSCFFTRVNAYRVRTLNTWISTAHLQGV